MADILTLVQYKAAKGITNTEYDTQLGAMIPMVNDFIENYCNRKFGLDEYTERREGIFSNRGYYVFNVDNKPVISVQSVSLKYLYR